MRGPWGLPPGPLGGRPEGLAHMVLADLHPDQGPPAWLGSHLLGEVLLPSVCEGLRTTVPRALGRAGPMAPSHLKGMF